MFSPQKGPDLDDLDHHDVQPLMDQQPLPLSHVPRQADPFSSDQLHGMDPSMETHHQAVHPNPNQALHHDDSSLQHPLHIHHHDHSLGHHTEIQQHEGHHQHHLQAAHQIGALSAFDHEGHSRPPAAARPVKKRRRYDNNFKAAVLEHLKVPHAKLQDVAKRFAIPENTLREWTKVSVVQSIEAARAKSGGTLKANAYDPLYRLAESLMVFFERNDQPITTKLIVAKGIEARNNLLELNEIQPFLDAKEKKALENFSGSDSWAKKFAKRNNLKMSGARVKDLGDEDIRSFR
mmetsp:Transcript_74281/g.215242  ORF Transcript_74281/g.215242 Transcript_74281/m.215242 type:complete len:291 (+) Transcript_74281:50-922(+)